MLKFTDCAHVAKAKRALKFTWPRQQVVVVVELHDARLVPDLLSSVHAHHEAAPAIPRERLLACGVPRSGSRVFFFTFTAFAVLQLLFVYQIL